MKYKFAAIVLLALLSTGCSLGNAVSNVSQTVENTTSSAVDFVSGIFQTSE
jgi:PBP1b-binding outer membrane lipoprotein LpoB